MKNFFLIFVFLVCFCISKTGFTLSKDDKNVAFLMNLQTLKSNFTQNTLNNKNEIETTKGKIVVKKPDSIALDLDSKEMRIKLVSINGNVKIIDKDLNQTTYLDNQYSELLQFFTNNLKPEKLYYDKQKRFCMDFQNQGSNWKGCLNIDLNKNTIKNLSVFLIDKQIDKTGKTTIREYPAMDIVFNNPIINGAVDNSEFYIKDNRIFDDEED